MEHVENLMDENWGHDLLETRFFLVFFRSFRMKAMGFWWFSARSIPLTVSNLGDTHCGLHKLTWEAPQEDLTS